MCPRSSSRGRNTSASVTVTVQGANRTSKRRVHFQRKKTALGWLSDRDRPLAHTAANTTQAGSGFQEGTRPAKDKLPNWRGVVGKDPRRMGLVWEEAETGDRRQRQWRHREGGGPPRVTPSRGDTRMKTSSSAIAERPRCRVG